MTVAAENFIREGGERRDGRRRRRRRRRRMRKMEEEHEPQRSAFLKITKSVTFCICEGSVSNSR